MKTRAERLARRDYLLRLMDSGKSRLEILSKVAEFTGRSYPATKRGLEDARADLKRIKT